MCKYIVVTTLCDKENVANKIVEVILNKKLAAGSQISKVNSKYWWNGKLEINSEYKIEFRTKKSLFNTITDEIKKLHDYEVAEISYYEIGDASYTFKSWIDENVRMDKEELINLIKSIKISSEEFTILSSSALVLRGIYDSAGDLDIAVTKKGLEMLKQKFELKQKENGWYIVNDKIECVLDDMEGKKEKLGDYYLQDINDYLERLKLSNREKDKLRIPIVEEYIKRK